MWVGGHVCRGLCWTIHSRGLLPIKRVGWVDPCIPKLAPEPGMERLPGPVLDDVGGGSRLPGPVLAGTFAGSPPSHFHSGFDPWETGTRAGKMDVGGGSRLLRPGVVGLPHVCTCPAWYIRGVTPQSLPINRVGWVDAGKMDHKQGPKVSRRLQDSTDKVGARVQGQDLHSLFRGSIQ